MSLNARLVIGLFCQGVRTGVEMAEVLDLERDERRRRFLMFVAQVLKSRNLVVVECLRWGLPADCPANLPQGVTLRCGRCRAKLTAVPCATCGRRPLLDQRPEFPGRVRMGRPLREPDDPTAASPGSLEKILVMRERIERGESCFHPGDERMCRRQNGDTVSQFFEDAADGDSLDFTDDDILSCGDIVSLPAQNEAA